MLQVKDADLRYGDKVSFNVCEMKRASDPGAKRAVNIKLLSRLGLQTGFVCSLKESYGFIETVAVDDEIFFHYRYLYGRCGSMGAVGLWMVLVYGRYGSMDVIGL